MKKLFLILNIMLLTACASTKQFVPISNADSLQQGNALIRVERKDEFIGGGRALEITQNGFIVGELTSGKSIDWQQASGKIAINISPSFGTTKILSPVIIDAESGKVYKLFVFFDFEKSSFVLVRKN